MVKQHGYMTYFAYLILKQNVYMTWFAYLIPWEMNMVCLHDSVGDEHGSVAWLSSMVT